MKKIKSFSDACKKLGIKKQSDVLPAFNPGLDKKTNRAIIGFTKMVIITKALNGEWVPDFSNADQPKYQIWWEFKPGKGFVLRGCFNIFQDSDVGSRLCFRSREIAEYAAKQFQPIYNEFLN